MFSEASCVLSGTGLYHDDSGSTQELLSRQTGLTMGVVKSSNCESTSIIQVHTDKQVGPLCARRTHGGEQKKSHMRGPIYI